MSDQPLLSELARVKALFQARTIAAVIGAPPPVTLEPVRLNPDLWPSEVLAERDPNTSRAKARGDHREEGL